MPRSTLLVCSAVCILIGAGCDSASHQENKAATAQSEADNKIASAVKEANDKAAAAQIEADKKVNEAQASLMKLREDYRHTTTNNLLEFDHKVSELESKANLAKGKTKVELENKLHQIRASRATFAADYQALENQTGAAWDSAKEKLDQEWTELKALVDKAE